MKKLPVFVIDAFTQTAFKGNPASVVPLDDWLPSAMMQAIATENNYSETAFFVKASDEKFDIRWFSPLKEIPFCGHATLASAHVIFSEPGPASTITFRAEAVGEIPARRLDDGRIEMSFPNRIPCAVPEPPTALLDGLSIAPVEVLVNQQAYIVVYESERDVRAVVPSLRKLAELGPLDVAVTARGEAHDFVSRYFWPANGGNEDPVTGSIHAGLAPYWALQCNKNLLTAMQVSQRTGVLYCRVEDERVHVSGFGVRYLEGYLTV